MTRQSSQNSSILEHFAFQAKELVKETARQSSQDGAGGILAHVADKLTTQAKKAAGEATKSVHEASKTAFEASKTAAGVSKNTFDDLTYVGKSTIGDLTKSAKQVASKKGFKVLITYLHIYFNIIVVIISLKKSYNRQLNIYLCYVKNHFFFTNIKLIIY